MDAVSDWLHYIALFEGFIGFRYPKKEDITIELLELLVRYQT
jgi:hypothetical protein